MAPEASTVEALMPPRRRLVGQPLLYTMTCFISLGVFLVRALYSLLFEARVLTIVHLQFGYDQGYATALYLVFCRQSS